MSNIQSGAGPLGGYPVIDERNREKLIEQIRKLAPHYVPEWKFRPEDPDLGTALSLLFVHLLEGNIRRLNRMPYKSFLAFLNAFHVELSPARPALAQVTFELAEGTPEPVYVEKGTQLAAQVPGEAQPVLFETAAPVLLTTARLTDLITVSPRNDRIVRLAGEGSELSWPMEQRGAALYGLEGVNLQEHAMYLRHDFLFLLKHPALLELTFSNAINVSAVAETVQLLSDTGKVSWEYYSGGNWIAFDRVYGRQSTIRLVKLYPNPLEPSELQESNGYWIRCRAKSLDVRSGGAELAKVQLDRIVIKSEYASPNEDDGIIPDRLFFNDLQVDAEEGCLPFGDFFAQYGLFYISNREAFSKRGANITIRFNLEFVQHRLLPDRPPQINWKIIMKRHEIEKTDIPDPVTVATVQWEYWNGSSWAMLPVGPEARKLFSVPWEGVETREVSFVCPEDIAEIAVNSEENFWIRARIVQVMNAYSANAIYYSPSISRMRLRFGYEKPLYPPQQMLLENNLGWLDRTHEVRTGGLTFRPFLALEGSSPSLWFGFDQPPEKGPIRLYFQIKPRHVTEQDVPFIEWEYLRKMGGTAVWTPLTVMDETNGFTQSGAVQFVGPHDFALETHFGVTRHWIRAVNRDSRYDREEEGPNVPRATRILQNTVLAVQQQTIRGEIPQRIETYDTADETLSEVYVLSEKPVLSEEVWVDETGSISPEELELLQAQDGQVEVLRDSEQEIMRVWVRYRRVDHFLRSGPADRHYMIDRAAGRIQFGNGTYGKKPPRDAEDAVRVDYTAGGGQRGNVPAGSITSLQDAIAFIDGVTNVFAAAGGCDAGTVEEAVVRGPKKFSHLNRAVTAEDFEWITREAHPNVAKVKCLPNRNAKLEKAPGSVTVVVLPRSGIGDGAHFQELKRTVESHLLKHAASHIAFPGHIRVIEPALLEIGVQATVWVRNMEDVVPVEKELIRKLNEYLDPVTGNADGNGWEIGQVVHPSMFYSLIKSVGPVVHIPRLSLSVVKVEHGERKDLNPERIAELPHGIVVPGAHRLLVELTK